MPNFTLRNNPASQSTRNENEPSVLASVPRSSMISKLPKTRSPAQPPKGSRIKRLAKKTFSRKAKEQPAMRMRGGTLYTGDTDIHDTNSTFTPPSPSSLSVNEIDKLDSKTVIPINQITENPHRLGEIRWSVEIEPTNGGRVEEISKGRHYVETCIDPLTNEARPVAELSWNITQKTGDITSTLVTAEHQFFISRKEEPESSDEDETTHSSSDKSSDGDSTTDETIDEPVEHQELNTPNEPALSPTDNSDSDQVLEDSNKVMEVTNSDHTVISAIGLLAHSEGIQPSNDEAELKLTPNEETIEKPTADSELASVSHQDSQKDSELEAFHVPPQLEEQDEPTGQTEPAVTPDHPSQNLEVILPTSSDGSGSMVGSNLSSPSGESFRTDSEPTDSDEFDDTDPQQYSDPEDVVVVQSPPVVSPQAPSPLTVADAHPDATLHHSEEISDLQVPENEQDGLTNADPIILDTTPIGDKMVKVTESQNEGDAVEASQDGSAASSDCHNLDSALEKSIVQPQDPQSDSDETQSVEVSQVADTNGPKVAEPPQYADLAADENATPKTVEKNVDVPYQVTTPDENQEIKIIDQENKDDSVNPQHTGDGVEMDEAKSEHDDTNDNLNEDHSSTSGPTADSTETETDGQQDGQETEEPPVDRVIVSDLKSPEPPVATAITQGSTNMEAPVTSTPPPSAEIDKPYLTPGDETHVAEPLAGPEVYDKDQTPPATLAPTDGSAKSPSTSECAVQPFITTTIDRARRTVEWNLYINEGGVKKHLDSKVYSLDPEVCAGATIRWKIEFVSPTGETKVLSVGARLVDTFSVDAKHVGSPASTATGSSILKGDHTTPAAVNQAQEYSGSLPPALELVPIRANSAKITSTSPQPSAALAPSQIHTAKPSRSSRFSLFGGRS